MFVQKLKKIGFTVPMDLRNIKIKIGAKYKISCDLYVG